MSLTEEINSLRAEIYKENIDPHKGLGTELFEFVSSLTPAVNVDLLTMNTSGQVLLSWRDDKYFHPAWHVPGGCIRLGETIKERVQKTALAELGSEVIFNPEPIKVFEMFNGNENNDVVDKRQRSHFITLVIGCRLPDSYEVPENHREADAAGCLKWFDQLPPNMVAVQECYRVNWDELKSKVMEVRVNG